MPQLDQDYVFLPQRLLADLRANPAAIGAYALIARLFLIYQQPIPLSAADLQRYDPTLSYGAARGALQRLVALRWLREHAGYKNHYTPTWGVIKGVVQPWRMDAPTLGRPTHVVTLRLDRRLLDIGLGRLIPHPLYPAQTHNRYLERPIFSLRDVGAYAQALGGQRLAATPALWRYGLIRDGVAQPLTGTADLIALASQRTLDGDGAAPTVQGLRLLGLERASAPPPPASSQLLFFVDLALIPDLIPRLIPDLIPPDAEDDAPCSAAGCAKMASVDHPQNMPGTPGIRSDSSDFPPNPPTLYGGGGGDRTPIKNSEHEERQPKIEASRPATESARLLRSINAFPSSIEELADLSAELVERAIAYAEAEPGIVSVPGWVVEALRRHCEEGWPIPEPRTKRRGMTDHGPIDVAAYTSGAYGDLFRLGSDTSDLEDTSLDLKALVRGAPARPEAEPDGARSTRGAYGDLFRLGSDLTGLDASACGLEQRALGAPVQPDETRSTPDAYGKLLRQGSDLSRLEAPAPAQEPDVLASECASILNRSPALPPMQPERCTASAGATVDPHRSADPSYSAATDAALTQELHANLLAQCGRRYRSVIAGLAVHTAGSTSVIVCGSVRDMAVVQNELLGAIHGVLARLGAPAQVVCTTRAAWQARHGSAGNTQSRPAAAQSPPSSA